jgi:uncharacterized protein YggE
MKSLSFVIMMLLLPFAALAEEPATIEVSTTGTVYLNPDVAYLDFMVKHTAESPKAARDGNQAALGKFIQAMRKAGVKKEDIMVEPVSLLVYIPQDLRYMDGLAPKLPQQQETAIRLMRVRVTGIKLPDLPRVWKLVDTAMAAGAEPVRDTRGYYSVTQAIPSFIVLGLQNRQAAIDRANRDAFAQSRKQAEATAALAGLKVKRLHEAKMGMVSVEKVQRDPGGGLSQLISGNDSMLGKIKASVTLTAEYEVGK